MRFLALLPLLVPSAEAYRPGDAKRAARAGFAAPEGHEDEHHLEHRQHVVDELSGCIASLNSETKALSHAIGVIATLSGDLGADLAHYMPTTPFHQSFVLNLHFLQVALYRADFNLHTIAASPYARGLAGAAELLSVWAQKAAWDAHAGLGEIGGPSVTKRAQSTYAELMTLRNQAMAMGAMGAAPVAEEEPAAEEAPWWEAEHDDGNDEGGAPDVAMPSNVVSLLQLGEGNRTAPRPARTWKEAIENATITLARLQSRRGGGAAPAPFPPAMYASALASLNHLDYYITYALEAFGELNAFATNIEQHGAHCLEEKLAELMSLGVRPGTADDVPPFVLAAAATVRLSAGAMRQLLLRFFLVPSSGYAQATTLLRRINAYLASQWLSISSTAALRNGPYGAIGEWAAKELPKAIVG